MVEVLDPSRSEHAGRLQPGAPPVRVGGKQAKSFESLRAWLRKRADPARFPDTGVPPILDGVLPSRRKLRIVADATQQFAWVQFVIQYASLQPGHGLAHEVRTSPLIRRFELEIRGTGRVVNFELGGEPVAVDSCVGLALLVDDDDSPRSVRVSPVRIRIAEASAPVGTIAGISTLSDRPGHVALKLDPPSTLVQLGTSLSAARARRPQAHLRLSVSYRASFVAAFEVLAVVNAAGFRRVDLLGLQNPFLAALGRDLLALINESFRQKRERSTPTFRFGRFFEPPLTMWARLFPRRGGRSLNLRAMGGGGKTQRAVDWGLQWLMADQRQDGAWARKGGAADLEATVFATLAFLATDALRSSVVRAPTVRALDWILRTQRADGGHGTAQNPRAIWLHALALQALVEAAGLGGEKRHRAGALKGLAFLLRTNCERRSKSAAVRRP